VTSTSLLLRGPNGIALSTAGRARDGGPVRSAHVPVEATAGEEVQLGPLAQRDPVSTRGRARAPSGQGVQAGGESLQPESALRIRLCAHDARPALPDDAHPTCGLQARLDGDARGWRARGAVAYQAFDGPSLVERDAQRFAGAHAGQAASGQPERLDADDVHRAGLDGDAEAAGGVRARRHRRLAEVDGGRELHGDERARHRLSVRTHDGAFDEGRGRGSGGRRGSGRGGRGEGSGRHGDREDQAGKPAHGTSTMEPEPNL